MEKYVDIKSPFTGGRVKEISTQEDMNYKGQTFTVHVRYYQCEDTGEKFTTTEQDQEWYNELQSLSRAHTTSYHVPEGDHMIVAENLL